VRVFLRASYAKTATARCGQASRRPISKIVRIRCFYSFSRFRHTRTPCRCRFRDGRGGPMGGGDGRPTGAPLAVRRWMFLALKNPIFRPFGSRNGSEMARATADYRPRSRSALLLEVINDRGELHCHRTRHRGGRALPVLGCPHPQGRFPRRCTLREDPRSQGASWGSAVPEYRHTIF
jgi:hypothetical protein